MKKNLLYTLVLATSMVACTEDYTDWAPAQQNGPEEAQSVTFTVAPASAIDLATVAEETVQLFVPTVQAVEGATTSYVATVYNEDKSDSQQLTPDSEAKVAVADLENAINYLYGRRPVARTAEVVVNAYTKINGQAVKNTATTTVTVTPEAPYISTTYYLIGAPSDWSPTCTTMPFTHSGKDVYEDPVFTVQFPVSDGECWFAFADDKTVAANDWSLVYGCMEGNGNNGTEGKVARRNALSDDGSFKVVVNGDAKYVKFTINMMDQTYKIEKVNFGDYIYEIGNSSGWGASVPLKHVDGNGNYLGFDWLDGEFKFKPNEGDWNDDMEYVEGTTTSGTLTTGGGPNCPDPGKGFYAIKVDMANMKYELVSIASIGLVGSATPGGWDNDTDMTYDESQKAWTVTCDLTDGAIKFRANDGWDYNWGGTLEALTQGGADIQVAAGNYTIVLKALCDGYASCTMTKN